MSLTMQMQTVFNLPCVGFIEEFLRLSFVLTCNFKNRIIEPLHSRCTNVEFRFTKEEQDEDVRKVLRASV